MLRMGVVFYILLAGGTDYLTLRHSPIHQLQVGRSLPIPTHPSVDGYTVSTALRNS